MVPPQFLANYYQTGPAPYNPGYVYQNMLDYGNGAPGQSPYGYPQIDYGLEAARQNALDAALSSYTAPSLPSQLDPNAIPLSPQLSLTSAFNPSFNPATTPTASPLSAGEQALMGGSGSLPLLPALATLAGVGLVGKGIYDTVKGKKPSGLSRLQTGITTGGISEIARLFNRGPKTEVEDKRVRKLTDAGITGFDKIFKATKDPHAWYRKDLDKNFIGNAPDGQWVNNKFAMSRNVSDLRPEDIWGYSAFGEKFGNDWLNKYSEGDRRRIAQQALDKGAVSEGKGSINIDWNKVGDTSGAAAKPAGVQVDPGRLKPTTPASQNFGRSFNVIKVAKKK